MRFVLCSTFEAICNWVQYKEPLTEYQLLTKIGVNGAFAHASFMHAFLHCIMEVHYGMSMETIVITFKMQFNAKNACLNRMCKHPFSKQNKAFYETGVYFEAIRWVGLIKFCWNVCGMKQIYLIAKETNKEMESAIDV